MSDARDTGKPFGMLYFGAIAALIGAVLMFTSATAIGSVLVISGTLVACTGMVLRGLYQQG